MMYEEELNILNNLNENHLFEMAYKRTDAINRCFDLGKKFTEYFHIIVKLGKDDIDFKHHCQELQSWYDDVRSIKLKENKKEIKRKIKRSELWDWFFTVGQNVEDVILEPYQELYEDFCFNLLSKPNKTIYEVLFELL